MSSFYYKKENVNGQNAVALGYNAEGGRFKDLLVKVSPENGNNLFCFQIGGKEIIYYNENKKLNTYFSGNPVLYPFPNRLRNCRWEFNGKKYWQTKNGIPVFLHSLVFDEKWDYREPVAGEDSVSLETYLNIDENHPVYPGFPFKHRLTVVYTLTCNKLMISYRVKNLDDRELPFGISFHTYFNKLSGDEGSFLSIPAKYMMEVTDDLLPTGKLLETAHTSYDLNSPVALGKLDLDDCFTGIDKAKEILIDYRTLGLKISIHSTDDFTHTQVYTPKGQPFFCVETQTCSTDAPNLHAQGFLDEAHLTVVKPQEEAWGSVDFGLEYCGK